MAEIERDFKHQNRWWKRLWRWVRGKKPVINVTQYRTYSNEKVVIPTMDDLRALAETLPPPPPKVNCVKHGRVAGTYPNKNMNVYCSICIEEWKLEFANQFSHAESVNDLRKSKPELTAVPITLPDSIVVVSMGASISHLDGDGA